MSTVKVAHITTIDMGLRFLLLNQMLSLQQDGFQVVGISAPGPYVEIIEQAGIRHRPVHATRRPFAPLDDLRSFWDYYRVLRAERPTIVHTHNPKPTLYGQMAARLAGVPLVVNTLHGYYFHDGTHPLLRRLFVAVEKLASRFADVILSQNQEDVATARREGICPQDRIKLLGNGIDVVRFDGGRFDEHFRRRMRASLGLSEQHLVIGYVGRLVREKGLMELFEAVAGLVPEFPQVRLLGVGLFDHEKPDALSARDVERLGIKDRALFTGHREDMPELYSVMDVLALPSYREGYPRAPMEASAMGVPSVVSDIRGCRETVEQGRNGLLVPVRDAPGLQTALARLLSDQDLRQGMGRAGRALAEQRFDERKVFDTVKQEYARLLRERGINRQGA